MNKNEYDQLFFTRVVRKPFDEFLKKYQTAIAPLLSETKAVLHILETNPSIAVKMTDNVFIARAGLEYATFIYDEKSPMVSPEGVNIKARVSVLKIETLRSMVLYAVFEFGYEIVPASVMLKMLNR